MKKLSVALTALIASLSIAAAGCNVSMSKSYTFHVETGDDVEVSLAMSDGLDLKQEDGEYTVTKDGKNVLSGVFITPEMRSSYIDAVKAEPTAQIISDTDDCFSWKVDGQSGKEYNRIVLIKGSGTYALIGSLINDEGAEEISDKAYGALSLEKAD